MTIFVPIFLLAFLMSAALLIRCVHLLVRRRAREAKKTFIVLASVLGTYAAALILVGVESKEEKLPLERIKCFDDWCVRVNNVTRYENVLRIRLDTINHGRRAQAPDGPRGFVVADGRVISLAVPGLNHKIDGGSSNPIVLRVAIPIGVQRLSFLVTEGGSPSVLVIGDENSPFHAKAVWDLTSLLPGNSWNQLPPKN